MKIIVLGFFKDNDKAVHAVSHFNEKGYAKDVSLVAKDTSGELITHSAKSDVSDGATAGALLGGSFGSLFGLIAGAVAATIPGGIILVAGPLAAAWGLSGAAVGSLGGGLLGAFTDLGLSKNEAKLYMDQVDRGQILVAVTTTEDTKSPVINSMKELGASEISSMPVV